MLIKKFKYLKEGTTEPKEYEVVILNKDETHEYGLSLSNLTEEERTQLLSIVNKYEEDTKPFMKKAWRNFKKSNILKE